MQKVRWFLWILGIALVLVLAIQNDGQAQLKLLWTDLSLPLSLLLVVTLGIGFLLGSLMTAMMLWRKKAKPSAEKSRPAESGKTKSSDPATPVS
ncbi:MAG: lipopolysaccharide assembly protein LapA domain-containing protein [Planctomycetota bacterium]